MIYSGLKNKTDKQTLLNVKNRWSF